VIRGSAINQDGASGGLTVPSGPSQTALVRQALARARVTPDQIDYVEAHGTGTALGDPIEVGALAEVFARGRPADRPLLLGSVRFAATHCTSTRCRSQTRTVPLSRSSLACFRRSAGGPPWASNSLPMKGRSLPAFRKSSHASTIVLLPAPLGPITTVGAVAVRSSPCPRVTSTRAERSSST